MEKYWLWLCTCRGMYRPYMEMLMQRFRDPESLFRASPARIREIPGIPEKQKEDLIASRSGWDPEKTIHELAEKGIRFISFQHPEYPPGLLELSDYPFGLFVKGKLPDPGLPAVAVIGARKCSAYGREKAGKIGAMLAAKGVQVVSGMARGIDGAAQRAALEAGGKSFGILGCGVDICYPRENIGLYDRLSREGGLLSEYPPGHPPLACCFPVRNRIISALVSCVVVVEAREHSGSLITADFAADLGREVLAVPGRMEDCLSRGCNRLISQGAGILWEEEELFRLLGISGTNSVKQEKQKLVLEKKENMVYSGLDFRDRSLDTICKMVCLPRTEVMEALVSLQLRGLIKETAKNHYVKAQN